MQVNGEATTETLADGTYTFHIEGTKGQTVDDVTVTITNGASNEVQVDNLIPDTYTVTEDVRSNPEGMSVVGSATQTVAVTANNTASIPTAEFTNNKTAVGSLKVKKSVTLNGAATTTTEVDGTYSFQILDENEEVAATAQITITNGVSDEVQVDNLKVGTYKVMEVTDGNPAGVSLAGDNGVEVEVTEGNAEAIPTAEFTNNKEVGSLKVKKNVTVNGETTTSDLADGTYTFHIAGTKGQPVKDVTITIKGGASSEVQVDNLIPDTYTVTEDTEKNPTGMAVSGSATQTVAVTANNTASIPTAEFTNDKIGRAHV